MLSFYSSQVGKGIITGLSTDAKPLPAVVGLIFLEEDTEKMFNPLNGVWVEVGEAKILEMTNRTGVTLVGGECVIIDTLNNNSVVFCNSLADSKRVCGIVSVGGVNLAQVKIKFAGRVTAVSNGVITRGDIIIADSGTPDGRVITDNTPTYNGFAKALTSANAGQNVELLLGLGIG